MQTEIDWEKFIKKVKNADMETLKETLKVKEETLKADGQTLKAKEGGKKKCYISLPISGRDMRVVKRDINRAKTKLSVIGYEPYAPVNDNTDITAPYSSLMGQDITTLLECDAVVFLRGWEQSKGCMLEFAAAKIYGKEIWFD